MDPRDTHQPPQPDPADWDWADQYTPPQRPPGLDLSALYALLEALRRLIPPELQEQFNALQRELLMTIRGLIDWQLERLEAGPRESEVEDIPIE
jgi:hypothetical protein